MFRYVISFCLLLPGCNALPWLEQSVRLPDGTTIVRIMIRGGGEYRTVVENEYGSAFDSPMPIGGAHRRTNLYLTPRHELVTIEAGGDSARFDITPGRAPQLVQGALVKYPPLSNESINKRTAAESYRWRYIGMVYREEGDFAYYGPKERAECIPLLGAGRSNFRKEYQSQHFCSRK